MSEHIKPKMRTCILFLTALFCIIFAETIPFKGQRQTTFDWSLVCRAITDENSNAVISPISIKFLLTLLYEAAGPGTDTEKQLRLVFENQSPAISRQREIFKKFIVAGHGGSKDYDFKFGTKIFAHDTLKLTQKYEAIAKEFYDTEIENLNFNDIKKAVDAINKWTSDATGGQIKNLADEETVKNAIILLLNTIYFKGTWIKPFPESTVQNKFHTSNGNTIDAAFMMQRNDFHITENDKMKAQILRLPYAGDKFAMFIILPAENSNLKNLLQTINENPALLNSALNDLKNQKIEVSLPKFKFDFNGNLNSAVKALGIHDIFTDSASLPLLSRGQGTNEEVRISNIIQKAGISVDQRGSVAYAASEFELVNKFDVIPNQNFYADRPFLFFIEDETNGEVLMAGKVENPLE